MTQTSFRDVKNLSALLDQKLDPAESARLQKRLKTDGELHAVYEDLRQTRSLLHRLPQRRAPRNFTLKPSAARVRPPLPRIFPAFRLASALASLLLFFSFATNAALPRLASLPSSAPAYAFGMGGGNREAADAAPEAAFASAPDAEEPSAKMFAEPTAALQAVEPALEAPAIPPPDEEPLPIQSEQLPVAVAVPAPIPAWTLIVLAVLAIASGGAAFWLRWRTDQRWKNVNKKIA